MNNTDKLLSDIANDVVLAWLDKDIDPEWMDHFEPTSDLEYEEFEKVYDRVNDTLRELAAFFERTIHAKEVV